jgi:hypothetical protein
VQFHIAHLSGQNCQYGAFWKKGREMVSGKAGMVQIPSLSPQKSCRTGSRRRDDFVQASKPNRLNNFWPYLMGYIYGKKWLFVIYYWLFVIRSVNQDCSSESLANQ